MLSRYGGLSLHRNRVVRLTYRPDMTSYGYGALNHHLTCVRAHLCIVVRVLHLVAGGRVVRWF